MILTYHLLFPCANVWVHRAINIFYINICQDFCAVVTESKIYLALFTMTKKKFDFQLGTKIKKSALHIQAVGILFA